MDIRNVAIIAHVDHGKTTLVDALLRQSKVHLDKEEEGMTCIMDNNDIERERGITIFSKNASVIWHVVKFNIIDTPGHADFGGEVERVLKMADGCLLLVDAKEGPMPQTRFVLKKALELGLTIIVVINKIDKDGARIQYVLDKILELFMELGADDKALDFPVIYASAKLGKAGLESDLNKMKDISPIFEAVIRYIGKPSGDPNKPLQLLVSSITGDNFLGRIATGRIYNGTIKNGQDVMHINRNGQMKKYRITSLMGYNGLDRVEIQEAKAGEIVAVSGIPDIVIGETIADINNPVALPLLQVDEPSVKVTFLPNNSPFMGQEGRYVTSRQLRERLYKELETDMALKVEDTEDGRWIVSGRGELHLTILMERLRREGYEFQVSRPQVITKEINGKKMVPFDELFIEVPEIYQGIVMQKIGNRNGILQNVATNNGIVYLDFLIPTRGLFGYKNELMTDTKGLGIMSSVFYKYDEDKYNWKDKEKGSLVASETGETNYYGLQNVQDRGTMFYGPQVKVYKGQVVGENSRAGDIRVNVCKTKQLSNMRSKGDGGQIPLKTPREIDLEFALEYIGDDELVEVTPKSIRIRKVWLDENDEARFKKGLLK
ncbi:MAG TPA: translational GTPase TypA [bacterium]|nr:translational GTPase TypA [Patescibacteria group bacterium]HOC96623.1 translational GTPase TypA [bacterium]HPO11268.1 translational GTPase TypA [bacterium]